jgi:hypothetical protein
MAGKGQRRKSKATRLVVTFVCGFWWYIDTSRAPRRTDPLSQNAFRNWNVRDRVENVASLVVLLSVHRCDEQNADGINKPHYLRQIVLCDSDKRVDYISNVMVLLS